MKIKKFVAPTIKQALAEVKQELGEDAVILHTKKVKQGGVLDFFGKELYEIAAAIDEMDRPDFPKPKTARAANIRINKNNEKTTDWKSTAKLTEITSDVHELKSTVQQMSEHLKYQHLPSLPAPLTEFYMALVNAGINGKLAQELVQQISIELRGDELEQAARIEALLKSRMAQKISTKQAAHSVSSDPYVIALIGPTGVGKTTTLAKMATHPEIYGSDRVAFISSDTYRIAAIEQLRTYAKIAGIPMIVTYSPDEIHQAIMKYQDKDVILIDTPGRSPYNRQHLIEIKEFLERAQPDEIHLVLSVTTRYEDVEDIINAYDIMKINRLLFTKLDETTKPGAIINVVDQYRTPISFITNGQEVPDDIKDVTPNYLVNLILKK